MHLSTGLIVLVQWFSRNMSHAFNHVAGLQLGVASMCRTSDVYVWRYVCVYLGVFIRLLNVDGKEGSYHVLGKEFRRIYRCIISCVKCRWKGVEEGSYDAFGEESMRLIGNL